MGRNRSSSYAESSDDDFALSDGDKSPARSRLKRPRRSAKPPRRLAVRSPQTSSFQLDDDDDDDDVICVPDSLEQDEPKQRQSSNNVESDAGPQDPSAENTMESAYKSEEPTTNGDGESKRVDVQQKCSPDENDNEHSTRSPRVLKQRKAYVISDSESEASAHENDDAYNSADDSPEEEEDDVESDFQLSPTRTAKKRKPSAPAKRATPPKKGKTQAKSKTTATKTAAKSTKKTSAVMQRSAPKQKKTTATLSSGAGKRRLGARIPGSSSALSSLGSSSQKARRPSSISFRAPLIRSGLSRRASVPPLHAYLKKN